MSSKVHLKDKHCTCCNIRLDKVKKAAFHAVSSQHLVEKLNSAKSTILVNKKKPIDNNVIQTGDFVCESCIAFSNRFANSTKKKTNRRLTVHCLYREHSEASTSREHDSTKENIYANEPEIPIEKITVNIPRIHAMHSCCVVCKRRGSLITVPDDAILDVYINRNILIPKDGRCCKSHIDRHKTFKSDSINQLTSESDVTRLTGIEVTILLDNLRHLSKTGLSGKFFKSFKISENECFRYTDLTKFNSDH